MFNAEQREYLAYLSTREPAQLCWCGWYDKGKCPHCPADKSAADKIAVRCPDCHNDPGWKEGGTITHRIGCPRQDEIADQMGPF